MEIFTKRLIMFLQFLFVRESIEISGSKMKVCTFD